MKSLAREAIGAAEQLLMKGDYGTALYLVTQAYRISKFTIQNPKLRKRAWRLSKFTLEMMVADVSSRTDELGIKVTPENEAYLIQEHSQHYARFREKMEVGQSDASQVPLYAEDVAKLPDTGERHNYEKTLFRIDNGFFQDFKKIKKKILSDDLKINKF